MLRVSGSWKLGYDRKPFFRDLSEHFFKRHKVSDCGLLASQQLAEQLQVVMSHWVRDALRGISRVFQSRQSKFPVVAAVLLMLFSGCAVVVVVCRSSI